MNLSYTFAKNNNNNNNNNIHICIAPYGRNFRGAGKHHGLPSCTHYFARTVSSEAELLGFCSYFVVSVPCARLKFKMGRVTLTTPLLGVACLWVFLGDSFRSKRTLMLFMWQCDFHLDRPWTFLDQGHRS